MTARRSRGEGGMPWDETRQRWIATVTIGYTPAGKRIFRSASRSHQDRGPRKLKDLIRDHDDGMPPPEHGYTVAQAVTDWLDYGLPGRNHVTVDTRRILATQHVIPALGARKLVDLSADEVDRWLVEKARRSAPARSPTSSPSCAARSPEPRAATRSAATSCCCAAPRPASPDAPPKP